jgi:hypothetical protein
MSTRSQRDRPEEGKIGLDSRVQVRHGLMDEIEEWLDHYKITTTFDERDDLVQSIDEVFEDGNLYHPDFPETNEDDDEHYNNHIIKEEER